MIELAAELVEKLKAVFVAGGIAAEQVEARVKDFEEDLTLKFFDVALKKIPEQDKKVAIEMVNSKNVNGFRTKLEEWLSEGEGETIWQKVTTQQLTELAQNLYSEASDEQKVELEKLIKPDILKGV